MAGIQSNSVPVNDPLYAETVEFLYAEAELLDSRRYKEWIGLLADDMQYRIPMQQDLQGRAPEVPMDWIDDDLDSLRLRVARLDTPYAYSEQPPSRMRHMITNIRVYRTSVAGQFDVTCNLLVYRHQGNRPPEIFCGERRDVVRKTEGVFRLAKRTITLEQTAMMTPSLGVPL